MLFLVSMKRVFLLIDDFTELTFLETLLKKIGFDTLGWQHPASALEKAMALTPDILIISDMIKGISTHEVLDTLKKYKVSIHSIVLKKDIKYKTLHKSVDLELKSPVDPEFFLRSLSKVAKINEDLIIEKYHKLGLFKGQKKESSLKMVKGKQDQSQNVFVTTLKKTFDLNADHSLERKKRFESCLKELPDPKFTHYDHSVAMNEMRENRLRENDPEIKDIDEQRKNFVKALFQK